MLQNSVNIVWVMYQKNNTFLECLQTWLTYSVFRIIRLTWLAEDKHLEIWSSVPSHQKEPFCNDFLYYITWFLPSLNALCCLCLSVGTVSCSLSLQGENFLDKTRNFHNINHIICTFRRVHLLLAFIKYTFYWSGQKYVLNGSRKS